MMKYKITTKEEIEMVVSHPTDVMEGRSFSIFPDGIEGEFIRP